MNPHDDLMEVPDGWGFVTTLDRRGFLKLTATGLLISIVVEPLLALGGEDAQGGRGGGYPSDPNAYVHIGADGRVTCFVGKIEMGQGVMTSLPQLAAEELNVPLTSIDIVMGDTDVCPWDMGTFGSLSIRQFGPVLRQAAAEARAILVQMAAERLQVPAADLTVENGTIRHATDKTKSVTYGALTEGKRIERKVEAKPAVEPVNAYTVVGKSAARRDALEKVTGKAKFAGDIPLAGVLHARVLRPPTHGATLQSADTSAAEAVPGVRVVRDADLIAVLHPHWDEADRALRLVKAAFSPSPSTLDNANIFEHLEKAAPAGRTIREGGALAEGEKLSATVFEQTYYNAYVAHAPMEPHSATATVENGKVTVWASTQTPFPLKSQLANALRLPPEQVRVITPYLGGGFGGKSASLQAIEAARLAKAVGKPVRVVWSREEEFFYDTFRPAAVIKVRSGTDKAGMLTFWDYQVIGAGERGSENIYDFPHHRTVARGGWNANTPGLHPFAIGPWRAPAANSNTFAREQQIDIMAAKAGIDPVDFRLKNLTEPQMRACITAAARTFGWTPKPAPSGRGWGVACGVDANTLVCAMAEVKVNKATGEVQVVRVVTAQDMGVCVNPEGALQQMEGCVTMGLGYALTEEVRFKNGEVLEKNFGSYDLPRFSWVPQIDNIIMPSELPSQGGGEPAIVTVGAVIANAIFDAVGARVVRMPMTPARVKAAT